jgi:hypothetical protein
LLHEFVEVLSDETRNNLCLLAKTIFLSAGNINQASAKGPVERIVRLADARLYCQAAPALTGAAP